ncbi:MAG TPA: CRISPR-associated primase-polymerase type B [Bacteroidales bacterium]|nr:CRISPR-associated primase-polymerase type B [Bacteroidales bacterium]HPR72991.1 CRISPR-associated primase-polymerase type B [Bacteroidales bacterium]
MLLRGENITKSNTEILRPKSVYEIYKEISRTNTTLSDLILRVRKVAGLDRSAYQALKKQLPFFTGSSFGDNTRSSEHFMHASYFILDIDKCFDNEGQMIELRSRLAGDRRLNLMFTSPGGLGLKLLFVLDEPCRSTKFFSDAYRSFASQLAKDYRLEDKIDLATHDATRVCFLSHDKQAYYNAVPEKISWKSYLPSGDLFLEPEDTISGTGEYKIQNKIPEVSNCSNDIQPDVYRAILKKLNPERRYPEPKSYFVPEILNLIEEPVKDAVLEHNISVSEIRNIQYGKKFCFSCFLHKAELNVYYGKKGFSVVITPANDTNPDLNKIVYAIVSELIFAPGFIIKDQDSPSNFHLRRNDAKS